MTSGIRLETCGPQAHAVHFADGSAVLFSYATAVAAFIPGRGYVQTDVHHSVTTSRHANAWTGKGAPKVSQEVIDGCLAGSAAMAL